MKHIQKISGLVATCSLLFLPGVLFAQQASVSTFIASPSSGPSPLAVTFIAGGSFNSYTVDFGDGLSISGNVTDSTCASAGVCKVSHTYQSSGTYTAKLYRSTCSIGSCPQTPIATVAVAVCASGVSSCKVSVSTSPSLSVKVSQPRVIVGNKLTVNWNGVASSTATSSAVALWLVDTHGISYGLIAGAQQVSGTYAWSVVGPNSTSTPSVGCPADGTAPCNVPTGTYAVVGTLYSPSNACLGGLCAGPSPVFYAIATSSPFVIATGGTTPGSCPGITHSFGPDATDATTGGDVSALQNFLIAQGYLSTNPTGYFGPATLAALQQWQSDNGVASSGSPETSGWGFLGPKTLRAMGCGGTTPTTPTTTSSVFSATPTSGTAPLTVTFSSMTGAGFLPTSQQIFNTIDFGDGQSAPAVRCSAPTDYCISPGLNQHSYASAGTYTAKLLRGGVGIATTTSATLTITVTGSTTTTGACVAPTHDLSLGTSDSDVGGDVTVLQNFLVLQGTSIYPQGLVTGFYGNATQAAVVRFQQAVKISPTGFVGPLTRAAIAAQCSGSNPTTPTPGSTKYSFTGSPTSGQSPLSVTFTAVNADTLESGSYYRVDFGDGTYGDMTSGTSANALSTSHTYNRAGTFAAKLLQERNICGGALNGFGCQSELQVDGVSITVSAATVTNPVTQTPSTMLYAGTTPDCDQYIVTNNPAHLNCATKAIGSTVTAGSTSAGSALYGGLVGFCNAAFVTNNPNFQGCATTPIGYALTSSTNGSPLYVITGGPIGGSTQPLGCAVGFLVSSPTYFSCTVSLLGYTLPN